MICKGKINIHPIMRCFFMFLRSVLVCIFAPKHLLLHFYFANILRPSFVIFRLILVIFAPIYCPSVIKYIYHCGAQTNGTNILMLIECVDKDWKGGLEDSDNYYESGPQTKNVLFFKTIFIYSTIQQHKGWNIIILGNMYFHRTGNKVSSINSVATVESKP